MFYTDSIYSRKCLSYSILKFTLFKVIHVPIFSRTFLYEIGVIDQEAVCKTSFIRMQWKSIENCKFASMHKNIRVCRFSHLCNIKLTSFDTNTLEKPSENPQYTLGNFMSCVVRPIIWCWWFWKSCFHVLYRTEVTFVPCIYK